MRTSVSRIPPILHKEGDIIFILQEGGHAWTEVKCDVSLNVYIELSTISCHRNCHLCLETLKSGVYIFIILSWNYFMIIFLLTSVNVQFNLGRNALHYMIYQRTCVLLWATLQWRHNEHDGVSNHQPQDCSLNYLFRRKSKKTSKLRVTGLCTGNSPVTGEFPAQRDSNAENVSIWLRHHENTRRPWRVHFTKGLLATI